MHKENNGKNYIINKNTHSYFEFLELEAYCVDVACEHEHESRDLADRHTSLYPHSSL